MGFKSSESLEKFIHAKLSNLKDNKIIRANVTLFKGSASRPENDYCEIRLEVPGNDHFVKKHNEHFEVAIVECVDILNKMITKSKEKKAGVLQNETVLREDNASVPDEDI